MLYLRGWIALKETRNARYKFQSVLYPPMFQSGKEEYLLTVDKRVNPVRRNNYLSLQPTLINPLQ